MSEHPYYWSDPFRDEFDITIESVRELDNTKYVKIHQNVVKPSGGGQAGDKGRLEIDGNSYEFTDTVLLEGLPMLQMKETVPSIGSGVLVIDMFWRRAMMRNHTSEHLFVGILRKMHPTVELAKIWIDGDHGTVVLEGSPLTIEDILEAESEVQRHIEEEIPVITRIVPSNAVDESVRARDGVTSKYAMIRIVNVGELDSSACSGIHVTNTREIRIFKVTDIKSHDSNTHIEFISDKKAVESMCSTYNAALIRKYEYPFELEQLGAILDKAKDLQKTHEEMVQKITQLLKEGAHKEELGSILFWHEYLPGLDANGMRNVMKELQVDRPSVILLFVPGQKSNFIFWATGIPKSASYYISEPTMELGGRGGGSKDSFTGGFTNVDKPLELFQQLVERVRERILSV